jgi:hypothetical protein
MIYVDPITTYNQKAQKGAERYFGNGKASSHMATDGDIDELHVFATKLGLKRAWLHQSSSLDHYDLTPNKRALAVRLGAIEVPSTRKLIEICKGVNRG